MFHGGDVRIVFRADHFLKCFIDCLVESIHHFLVLRFTHHEGNAAVITKSDTLEALFFGIRVCFLLGFERESVGFCIICRDCDLHVQKPLVNVDSAITFGGRGLCGGLGFGLGFGSRVGGSRFLLIGFGCGVTGRSCAARASGKSGSQ